MFSAEQMLRCVETTPFLSQLPHLEVTEARMTHCEAAHKLVANCSSLQPSLTCQLCVMPLDACGWKINEFGKPCQQLAAVMNIARYCEGGAFRQNWHEPAVDCMRGVCWQPRGCTRNPPSHVSGSRAMFSILVDSNQAARSICVLVNISDGCLHCKAQ